MRTAIAATFTVAAVGLLSVSTAAGNPHDASDFFIFSRAELGQFAEPDCNLSNDKQADVSGSNNQFFGRIHSNADLAVSGTGNRFTSPLTFGTHDEDCQLQAEPQASPGGYAGGPPSDVDSAPLGVGSGGWPGGLSSSLDASPLAGSPPHRATFSSVEQVLPGETCDVGDLEGAGVLTLSAANDGQVVCNGTGKVQLGVSGTSAAAPLVMSITILSHGTIDISGQHLRLTPAAHDVLAMTDQSSSVDDVSIKLSGSNLDIPERGILFTPQSGQDISGSNGSEMCVQLIGQGRIKSAGSNSRFGPGLCAPTAAPAETFTIEHALLGASVTIETGGGIWPFEVSVLPAREYMLGRMSASFAGPAVDIDIPETAPPIRRATLTLPYREERLGGAAEGELRIYGFDEDSQFWVKVPGEQTVDTGANTVTASVTHFSVYAVLKGRSAAEWAEIFGNTPVRCVGSGSTPIDVVLLVDSSGSMSTSDPSAKRVDAAKLFVDAMRPSQDSPSVVDRASVVDFDSFARRIVGLTALDTGRDAVKAALEQTRNASGGTDISAAVHEAITILSANGGGPRLRVAVLLTDGQSLYNTALTTQAAEQAIEIHTVGLGPGVNATLLQDIASGTGATYRFLSNADDLPPLFRELARDIIGDDTDTDGDTLTDCVERTGMFVPINLTFPIGPPAPDFPSFITTDQLLADTDGDTLPDGGPDGEVERRSLVNDPVLAAEYSFLIDAGLTDYYVMHSDPRKADTDGDGLRDDLERANGTNPLIPEQNELGIEGLDLPPFTLFQPLFDDEEDNQNPVVETRWDAQRGEFITYNETPVSWQVPTLDCRRNCAAVRAAAEARDPGSWCWLLGCASVEERMRDVVLEAIMKQGIFNPDGSVTESFVRDQGHAGCVLTNSLPGECDAALDAAPDGSTPLEGYDEAVSEMLMALPSGYNPKDLCGGPNSKGGTYRLIDPDTRQAKYVGETGDYAARRGKHARDPRFEGLEFEPMYRTDNYQVRRGLEQRDYNDLWGDVPREQAQAQGSLNGQRPLARDRADYDFLLELAQDHIDLC